MLGVVLRMYHNAKTLGSGMVNNKDRRDAWILANGPCQVCGGFDRLEVDHIDPQDKLYKLSDIWHKPGNILERELSKCQVLCFKCHKTKTNAHNFPRKHGTASMYKKERCRCVECVEYNTNIVKEWRKKWNG